VLWTDFGRDHELDTIVVRLNREQRDAALHASINGASEFSFFCSAANQVGPDYLAREEAQPCARVERGARRR
jgi:hypothetical protein